MILPSMSALTGNLGVGAVVRMLAFATFMSSSDGLSSSCSTQSESNASTASAARGQAATGHNVGKPRTFRLIRVSRIGPGFIERVRLLQFCWRTLCYDQLDRASPADRPGPVRNRAP